MFNDGQMKEYVLSNDSKIVMIDADYAAYRAYTALCTHDLKLEEFAGALGINEVGSWQYAGLNKIQFLAKPRGIYTPGIMKTMGILGKFLYSQMRDVWGVCRDSIVFGKISCRSMDNGVSTWVRFDPWQGSDLSITIPDISNPKNCRVDHDDTQLRVKEVEEYIDSIPNCINECLALTNGLWSSYPINTIELIVGVNVQGKIPNVKFLLGLANDNEDELDTPIEGTTVGEYRLILAVGF